MPGLSLANSITDIKDTITYTQMVTDDPVYYNITMEPWPSNTSNISLNYSSIPPTTFIIAGTGGGNGWTAAEYDCIPNSEYRVTVNYELSFVNSDDPCGKIKIGTSANDNSLGEENVARSLSQIDVIKVFDSGNNSTFWLTLFVNLAATTSYIDTIKIEETGKYT